MGFNAVGYEILAPEEGVIESGTEVDVLYRINQKKNQKSFLTAKAEIWHKRFGHLNSQSMQKQVSMVGGIDQM